MQILMITEEPNKEAEKLTEDDLFDIEKILFANFFIE